MLYLLLKSVHIFGVFLLLGNVTVTAIWKVFADRTRDPFTVAFAQRLVIGTDWALTLSGVMLTMIGGYGMAIVSNMNLFSIGWLAAGQVLFGVSGLIWIVALIPLQVAQRRIADGFNRGEAIPDVYWRLGRQWLLWGLLATLPLFVAMFLMIVKP